jgi:ADP-heptose:LPS heptosyltransferase
LAALIAQFDLLLCHDSGPMHLAAAVGTRVVALLGSQNPVLFAPPGEGHIVLQPPLPCTACVAPGECVPGDSYRNYCVRNLPVGPVFTAVRDQLARPAAWP